MKHYEFQIILSASGNTPEEAWEEACNSIMQDGFGEMRKEEIITEEEM